MRDPGRAASSMSPHLEAESTDLPSAEEEQLPVRSGGVLGRGWHKLRTEGVSGVYQALKWKAYRRKDMYWCVRDNSKPVRPVRRHLASAVTVELAEMRHLEPLAVHFPHKRDWFLDRLQQPEKYGNTVAMLGDELVAHNWYCRGPHYDPEMRCVVDPGPRGAYWFEGWCRPDWRGKGIANIGMNWAFQDVFPSLGIERVVTLLEEENRPTRRIHNRYHFEDQGIVHHRRYGPFYRTSDIKPLEGFKRSDILGGIRKS